MSDQDLFLMLGLMVAVAWLRPTMFVDTPSPKTEKKEEESGTNQSD